MPITYHKGSIFQSKAQTLTNPVNTVGVMGAGLAAQFAAKYPIMLDRYKHLCNVGSFVIGQLWLYRSSNLQWVLNFPTKRDWRNPSKLEWVQHGLHKFMTTYADQGITSIAFPAIGCGRGELRWDDVQPLMHKHLAHLPIPVEVWLL